MTQQYHVLLIEDECAIQNIDKSSLDFNKDVTMLSTDGTFTYEYSNYQENYIYFPALFMIKKNSLFVIQMLLNLNILGALSKVFALGCLVEKIKKNGSLFHG